MDLFQTILWLYEFWVGILKNLFGVDIPSVIGQAREFVTGFYNLFAGFPPLFLQLAGFALVGIVVGIVIRLL